MTDHRVDAMAYGLRVLQHAAVPEGRAITTGDMLLVHPADRHRLMAELDDYGKPHSAEAHEAITAELVACTLGARQRPELRTDLLDRVADAARRAGEHVAKAMAQLRIHLPASFPR